VTEGDAYVSAQLAEFLLGDARASAAKELFALTDREREILRLVAEGDTDADIAPIRPWAMTGPVWIDASGKGDALGRVAEVGK